MEITGKINSIPLLLFVNLDAALSYSEKIT